MNNMYTTKKITPILLLWLLIILSSSCNNTGFGQRADSLFLVSEGQEVFYKLRSPDQKFFLPYVLEEISGLAFKEPNSVLAVDDETGKVFEFDLAQRDIVHAITFYKSGDYEGIELVNNNIYVLRSDGDLFMFDYTDDKEVMAIKMENELSRKNDTEGLGFDPVTNQLLIACKEEASLDESKKKKKRAFYAFDIATRTLDTEPIFTISPKKLKAFWEEKRDFDYDEDRIKFKPSAIAKHPITSDYYILSSVGKMVIVVAPSGDIQATYPIYSSLLGQLEGIAFSPKGDLYISSEGEGDKGYILKYEMKTR